MLKLNSTTLQTPPSSLKHHKLASQKPTSLYCTLLTKGVGLTWRSTDGNATDVRMDPAKPKIGSWQWWIFFSAPVLVIVLSQECKIIMDPELKQGKHSGEQTPFVTNVLHYFLLIPVTVLFSNWASIALAELLLPNQSFQLLDTLSCPLQGVVI